MMPQGLNSPGTIATDARNRRRNQSASSDSDSSPVPPAKRSPFPSPLQNTTMNRRSPGHINASATNLQTNFSRPTAPWTAGEPSSAGGTQQSSPVLREGSPSLNTHRRQHSQGFFEPSLPTASHMLSGSLTPSQAAAQAAMHTQSGQHYRKRSTTIPDPSSNGGGGRRRPPSPPPVPTVQTSSLAPGQQSLQYQHGVIGGNRVAATTAANIAFPRSPLSSPTMVNEPPQVQATPPPPPPPPPPPESKPGKDKPKKKLFSKPKNISITKEKEHFNNRHPPMPSPNKMPTGSLLRMGVMNSSSPSLLDSVPGTSYAGSMYSVANTSQSTLVPLDRERSAAHGEKEKEKEKKHNFLSRQKNKVWDKESLPLSSAASNSRPTDPNDPQPLYSFAAPASPGHQSSFAKSVSGLDLRHGGRALREKKKEEKAQALAPAVNLTEHHHYRDREASLTQDRSDRPGLAPSYGSTTSVATVSPYNFGQVATTPGAGGGTAVGLAIGSGISNLGTSFGVTGMSQDDAWPIFKARLMAIFDGQDPRPPIEDFNALLQIYVWQSVKQRDPAQLVDDVRNYLLSGFITLDQNLRHVPDERIIPRLVDIWLSVHTKIIPFLNAAFMPLDLEFQGEGTIMSQDEAASFWGAVPQNARIGSDSTELLGETLSTGRIALISFRDTIILPRFDTLIKLFSRISLDHLNTTVLAPNDGLPPLPPPPPPGSIGRPGTANSHEQIAASFNSQGSTLLDSSQAGSFGARSRATSNTSAGSFHSAPRSPPTANHFHSQHQTHYGFPAVQPAPSAFNTTGSTVTSKNVTDIAGKMFQCLSIVSSLHTDDDAQARINKLSNEFKHNWLGGTRTGGRREGIIGTRMPKGGFGAVAAQLAQA